MVAKKVSRKGQRCASVNSRPPTLLHMQGIFRFMVGYSRAMETSRFVCVDDFQGT